MPNTFSLSSYYRRITSIRYLFDLLKRGYIDARYREDYIINENELKELIDKVTSMVTLVEKICKQKIDSF